MYLEKREFGKHVKCYLVHSYRDKGKVKKLRKYLGNDLSLDEIKSAKEKAQKEIEEILKDLSTEIFNFRLTKNQIKKLNKYNQKIKIEHLNKINWMLFKEEFVYNTNAIEGSTVQLNEVKEILEHNKRPSNLEEIETKNVANALDFIRITKEEFSLNIIKKMHKICFENTKYFAGKFRKVEVAIWDSKREIVHRGIPISKLDSNLKELVNWYHKNKTKFKPLILAAIMHNQFEYIHPFQDGNGRVGRLLLNWILIKNNYPPLNIRLRDRAKYYYTLQEYQKNQDIKPTIKFLIDQYKKTFKQVTTNNKNKKK